MDNKRMVRSREANYLSDGYLENQYQIDVNHRYFDPERIQTMVPRGIPSEVHFRSIVWFLWTLEHMVPHVIQELTTVADTFTDAVVFELEQAQQNVAYEEYLPTLYALSSEACVAFKLVLLDWGRKYHFMGTPQAENIYLEAAIRSIKMHKYPIETDQEGLDRKTIELFTFLGIKPTSKEAKPLWNIINDPAHLSMLKGLFRDPIEFSDMLSDHFAFVFAPSSKDIIDPLVSKEELEETLLTDLTCSDYEDVLRLDAIKSHALFTLHRFPETWTKIPEMPSSEYTIPFRGVGWDPRQLSWKEFRSRIETSFHAYLEHYFARMAEFLQDENWIHFPDKTAMHHYLWFVQSVYLGMSDSQIANAYSDVSDIIANGSATKAVSRLSELLFIPIS